MMAAPKLLAGLMPVPVMGMVARWTKNTAKPMGRGAKSYETKHKERSKELMKTIHVCARELEYICSRHWNIS